LNLRRLEDQLIAHEDLKLTPYRDSVGKLTIGVGRNLDDKGLSKREALFLLSNDIAEVIHNLNEFLPWWESVSEDRQLVLADMCFNLGIEKLLQFKNMLEAVRQGRYDDAAKHMGQSLWARQVGNRAVRLEEMMIKG
jgi:lysozyme